MSMLAMAFSSNFYVRESIALSKIVVNDSSASDISIGISKNFTSRFTDLPNISIEILQSPIIKNVPADILGYSMIAVIPGVLMEKCDPFDCEAKPSFEQLLQGRYGLDDSDYAESLFSALLTLDATETAIFYLSAFAFLVGLEILFLLYLSRYFKLLSFLVLSNLGVLLFTIESSPISYLLHIRLAILLCIITFGFVLFRKLMIWQK